MNFHRNFTLTKRFFIGGPGLWALATAVLFATSYPPFPAWALFFAFAPLWICWYRAKTLKEVVLSGFVAQFTFTLIGFNWIAHTAIEYGHIPIIPSVLILVGFCCFASLNVVVAGIILWYMKKKLGFTPVWFFVAAACVSGACDWLYPMIFPWNTAYPLLYSHLHSAQLAEFIGFNLLSVFVYLASSMFATAYVKFPQKGWSRPLIYFAIGLLVAEGLGFTVEKRLPPEDKHVTALLVQPNIGNYDKYFAERGNGYQAPVVEKDFNVTSLGLMQNGANGKKPDLIIWPETAYPEDLDPWYGARFYAQQLKKYVDEHGIPLITGAYSQDEPTKPNRRDYNAMFAVLPGSPLTPGYRKQVLLAFGEYFPGAEYFPFLKTIVPEISDFGRGHGNTAFDVAGARFLPLICYEGLDTEFVRRAVRYGGNILVNITNDSWFGTEFEPKQHMIMTVARTVEYRRPLVRVTNTGISAVADVRGHILFHGPIGVEWAGLATIPYYSNPADTLFSSLAPYVSVIFLALVLLVIFAGRKFSDQTRT